VVTVSCWWRTPVTASVVTGPVTVVGLDNAS
jgi:hypothetical protein